jgi:hypothetical protein
MTKKYTFGIPLKEIRHMAEEERQRVKAKESYIYPWLNLCVSCGCPTPNTWCEFCLEEE